MNPHRTAQANEAALRKVLTQRTLTALSKQNVVFVLEHQNATRQELSQYLARCHAALGRAPARTEVLGGDFIELRFGSWAAARESIGVENGGRIPDKHAKREKKAANKELLRQAKAAKKAAQTSASGEARKGGQ